MNDNREPGEIILINGASSAGNRRYRARCAEVASTVSDSIVGSSRRWIVTKEELFYGE
jgi:hypothetical protein